MVKRIDDCLSARDGHLFVEECDAVDLIERFGSPLFVMSEDQIRRNVRKFQKTFQEGWGHGRVKVLPAAKANWLPAVQRILADEGCGSDIYSLGELTIALDAGVDPRKISANGVPKDESLIHRCAREGVRVTIDSEEEVALIEKAACDVNRPVRVRLRIKPAISGFVDHSDFVADGLVPADIAAMVYKGGLTLEQIRVIGPRLLGMKNVELVGLHQHHGRHDPSTRYWKAQMRAFAEEAGRVSRILGGFQPREIDIGGGFAVPRDPFNAVTDYCEPLLLAAFHAMSKGIAVLGSAARYKVLSKLMKTVTKTPNETAAPSIEEYARVCTDTLGRELPRNGISVEGLTLQIEPGRAIHGNAGVHLTTVKSIKRMKTPIYWNRVIVDTTEFWFTGGRYEHHLHDYLLANRTEAPIVEKADIVGRSCYGDRMMPMVPVPDVKIDDILAILDTGAYQEVSMSNFNALPRPATVLVAGDRADIIRRRETEEDLLFRDIVPERLKR